MLEQIIKEQTSQHLVGLIGSASGFLIDKPVFDFGVDLNIKKLERYKINNKIRVAETGELLHVQLKCTDQRLIKITEEHIKYDCPAKNYNDLIRRKAEVNNLFSSYVPLVLFLVVIPFEKQKWISNEPNKWVIKSSIYWYYPHLEATYSKNKESHRIKIPLENKLNLKSLPFLFNLLVNNNSDENS